MWTTRLIDDSIVTTVSLHPAIYILIALDRVRTTGHKTFAFETPQGPARISIAAPVQIEGEAIRMVKCSREVMMGARSYFPNSSSCLLCRDCDQAFEHLVNIVFVTVSVASSMVAEQFVTREVSIKLGEGGETWDDEVDEVRLGKSQNVHNVPL